MKRIAALFLAIAVAFLVQCSSSFTPQAQTTGTPTTVSVGTTTTGPPGTPASVVNVGSPTAVELNFTIPQGVAGPTGPAGIRGTAGPLITPLVVTDGFVKTVNPNGSPFNGGVITATFTYAQVISLTVNASISISGPGECSAFIFENGAPLNVSQSNGGSTLGGGIIFTASGGDNLQSAYFLNVTPGTDTFYVNYLANSNGNAITCDYNNAQLSLQPYGAGSTMQSSGTF